MGNILAYSSNLCQHNLEYVSIWWESSPALVARSRSATRLRIRGLGATPPLDRVYDHRQAN